MGKSVVHFLHIGKTGGTALRYSLKGISLKGHKLILHGHDKSLKDIPEGQKVVFFLRDPISRYISGFYSRKREGKPRYTIPWRPEEHDAFNHFESAVVLAESLSHQDVNVRDRAKRAMTNIQHVKDRYSKWLISPEYLSYRSGDILFVGFQESLAHDFVALKQLLCLPGQIDLPQDSIEAHKNDYENIPQLSENARLNLRNWYSVDYKILNTALDMRNKTNTKFEYV
jgi:hypothetical protein